MHATPNYSGYATTNPPPSFYQTHLRLGTYYKEGKIKTRRSITATVNEWVINVKREFLVYTSVSLFLRPH